VNDLIERPDLGVPEGGQRGIGLAFFVGFAEALFHFGERTGFDIVSTHFVDHDGSLVD
jgi:hypothetical protein